MKPFHFSKHKAPIRVPERGFTMHNGVPQTLVDGLTLGG